MAERRHSMSAPSQSYPSERTDKMTRRIPLCWRLV